MEAIPKGAFAECESLRSITLPPSVKAIADDSFRDCENLQNSPIPEKSEIVRIGSVAFENCSALKSMFLPSTIEVVGEDCFIECNSLSSLTFGLPSHLRVLLSLPPVFTGFFAVPDSVQMLGFNTDFRGLVLTFGRDSRLWSMALSAPGKTFAQVSTRSLKFFRKDLEFDSECERADEDCFVDAN
jgi:hypothetical protein